jgi:hypothetical protein
MCGGSSCRKKSTKRKALLECIRNVGPIEEVGCQEICRGPVVGFTIRGRVEWFKKIDTKKSRKSFLKLATGGKLSKTLKKRRVKKRAGRCR